MADCFEMESQLAHSMFEAGEIFEGVRALLVEKDFNPRWRYPTLESVTKHQISEMFEQSKEKLSFQI